MVTDKYKVELCSDHFKKLVDNNTCHTCPSRIENEGKVKALSALLERDSAGQMEAVVSELYSIRESQKVLHDQIQKIDGKVNGNGSAGIAARLLILETRQDVASKNTGTIVAIGTAIVGAIISIIGIMVQ